MKYRQPALDLTPQLDFDFSAPESHRKPEQSQPISNTVSFPDTAEKPFGSWTGYNERLSPLRREEINNAVIEKLAEIGGRRVTAEEREDLKQYSGFGGIAAHNERGVLYDYYTSPPIARMTWELLNKIEAIKPGDAVLEPSCGTGVFFETAQAAQAIHPGVSVTQESFEQFNLHNTERFDYIIGNAPFGDRTADLARLDLPDERNLDRYFIQRSIDTLKPGGAMALIVHAGVLTNTSNTAWRLEISKKAQFMGAVQLNNHSFSHAATQIQPVILFFKKHPHENFTHIPNQDFASSPLYNAEWVNGGYLDTRGQHIMGELRKGEGQWGSDLITGDITRETIARTLENWKHETPYTAEQYKTAEKEAGRFITAPEDKIGGRMSLTEEESGQVREKYLKTGQLKIVQSNGQFAIYVLGDYYSWELRSKDGNLAKKLQSVLDISSDVKELRKTMRASWHGAPAIGILQDAVKAKIELFEKTFGGPAPQDKDIKRFLRHNPAVTIYDGFARSGSAILNTGNLYSASGEYINGHNEAVQAIRYLNENLILTTKENIEKYFPGNGGELLHEFERNPDVFYGPDRSWELREDFISGNVYQKIDSLAALKESRTDEAHKIQYGIDELKKAVHWIPIEQADFSGQSAWIPANIIGDWITSEDGLHKAFLIPREAQLAKNNTGKWGVRYITGCRKFNRETRESDLMPAGEWYKVNAPVIYYLNGEKQRNRTDTEAENAHFTESFKSYIANHPDYREQLETAFNRLFNSEIKAPTKTYPVYIEGWNDDINRRGKILKGHQWQSFHHLYREGKGISALGTGFGKTLTGIALAAILQQEGRAARLFFQVPNNKVKDWAAEFHDVLPNKIIRYIDPERKGYGSRENRYKWYQEIANSKFDILIMGESSASEISLNTENDRLISDEVISKYVAEKAGEESSRYGEEVRLAAEYKLQNGKSNKTITFEDFGCSALFVDEAHNYKNLFTSSTAREIGLNDGRRSDRALSLFKKCEYIRRNNNDKNIFLFTATPLTNSPLEYYNMLLYIAPEELDKFGTFTIDSFIKNFADVREDYKYDWKTQSVRTGKVLKGFSNLETLQNLFFKYVDLQNDPKSINIEKPEPENVPHAMPVNGAQLAAIQDISGELEDYMEQPKDFPGQNFLTFYSRLRTASLDLELYDPALYKDWANPKLAELAETTFDIFASTKAAQIIFCDRILSGDKSFNLHDKIKKELVKAGFATDTIAVINGFTKSGSLKSDQQIDRDTSAIVEEFNRGKYKILIGSTQCMGEGLNLQKNTAAVHHFDIPYRPSDFIQRNGRADRQDNKQGKVSLHTYLSAGTCDNYSVGLVQGKANWIDQILKTKTNVFTNVNNGDNIDIEKLQIALTAEFGDKGKAQELEAEYNRKKEEKIREAQLKALKDDTASIIFMRNAKLDFTGNTNTVSYKAREERIKALERKIIANPLNSDSAYTKQEIIGAAEKMLYFKDSDTIVRTGDLFIFNNKQHEVLDFNTKKKEIIITSLRNDLTEHESKTKVVYTLSKHGTDFIHNPDAKTKEHFMLLHTKEFYRIGD
ncbi:MAG: N-6 DNA methylase, partial [Treponema sp.]|nr:N-6 DNA methylase [Treponema sp.]